jgi:hypothetical protein
VYSKERLLRSLEMDLEVPREFFVSSFVPHYSPSYRETHTITTDTLLHTSTSRRNSHQKIQLVYRSHRLSSPVRLSRSFTLTVPTEPKLTTTTIGGMAGLAMWTAILPVE